MTRSALITSSRRQRGVTLIVVLLILVVVTILGIGAAQIALLGERSTRYDRDYLIAGQAAEAALMDAENDINGPVPATSPVPNRSAAFTDDNLSIFLTPGCGTSVTTQGLCPSALPGASKQIWETVDFLNSAVTAPTVAFGTYTGRVYNVGAAGIRPDRLPRYVIEMVDDNTPGLNAAFSQKLYRITAMGFGPRPDIQVVMQTVYRK